MDPRMPMTCALIACGIAIAPGPAIAGEVASRAEPVTDLGLLVPPLASAIVPFVILAVPVSSSLKFTLAPAGLCAGQLYNRDYLKAGAIAIGAPVLTSATILLATSLSTGSQPYMGNQDPQALLFGAAIGFALSGGVAIFDAYQVALMQSKENRDH